MEELGPRDSHQSMVAAAECPKCGHDTATPELVVDSLGVVVRLYLECRLCGCLYT